MSKIALISDFDGTISIDDFYKFVIDELLDGKEKFRLEEYKQGLIKHTEALNTIFNKIRLEEEEFKKFILRLPIQKDFVKTVKLAKEKKIDFYIISAGCDYYINLIMKDLGVDKDVTVLTNYSSYSKEKGLNLIALEEDNPYYSEIVGIDKKRTVELLKEKYDKCIYAGDSLPDYDPCQICDVVFARSMLAQMLDEIDFKYKRFDSYNDILNYISNYTISL